MTSLSEEAATAELRKSRIDLEAILGRPVALFAFPYGRHNESLVRWCKEAGYQRVFTIQPKLAFLRSRRICDRFLRGFPEGLASGIQA